MNELLNEIRKEAIERVLWDYTVMVIPVIFSLLLLIFMNYEIH